MSSRINKKKFNSLEKEDKLKVATVALTDAIERKFSIKIAEAMITGEKLCIESLYEKYVKKMDSVDFGSDEWKEICNSLLSDIRVKYVVGRK